MASVLTIPDLWNSGPDHWQTHWERERGDTWRVQQRDWETPKRQDWVENIRKAIRAAPAPVLLAAHSLGWWRPAMPLDRLPFRAIVVSSSDDEWVTSKLGAWPEGQELLERLLAPLSV